MNALPDVPACWTWPDTVVRPVRNSPNVVRDWQDGRCGICGDRPPVLVEDHDHASGATRGYLCAGCNVREGGSRLPVFERYRERPPFAIVGVLHGYQRIEHPDVRAARIAWANALSTVEELIKDEQEYQSRLRIVREMRPPDAPWDYVIRPAFRTRRFASPLVHDAIRRNFRMDEQIRMRNWPMVEHPDLSPFALAQVMPEHGDLMRGVL